MKPITILCAALLLLLLGACTSSTGRVGSKDRTRLAKIEAILAAMRPEMEQSFREGPPYFLTELRGMDAANKLGPEGKDASRLWEQEITARYQNNRRATIRALRREVAGYDDAMMDDIFALMVPNAPNQRPGGPAKTRLVSWSFSDTTTARAAHTKAVCQSLTTTPLRWAKLYPDRMPFTFERFNIDYQLLKRWCRD